MATKKHYDGQGHETLDFFAMAKYYQGDLLSLDVLKKYPPFKYQVIPRKVFVINLDHPNSIYAYTIYPGKSDGRMVEINDRQLDYLRRLYSDKSKGWQHEIRGKLIYITKEGRLASLVLSPLKGG
jgi:hypothetical protein